MTKKLFIVDGYAFIFRAYFASPKLTTPDGIAIGAIHGFVKMMLNLVDQHDVDNIVITLDKSSSRSGHRYEMYPEYKSHRPPIDEDLASQLSIMREAIDALGMKYMELDGFEADDIIASYVERMKEEGDCDVVIVSSDKDLYQLIDTSVGVSLYDPIKDVVADEEFVMEKLGVHPNQMVDYLALVGDAADNIPGVRGVGPKTAVSLLEQFDNLDRLYEQCGDIESARVAKLVQNGKDDAFMSRDLVRLKSDIAVMYGLDELAWSGVELHVNSMHDFFTKYSLRSLSSRYLSKYLIDDHDNPAAELVKKENFVEDSLRYDNPDELSVEYLDDLWSKIRYDGYLYIDYELVDAHGDGVMRLDRLTLLFGKTEFIVSGIAGVTDRLRDHCLYDFISKFCVAAFVKKITWDAKPLINYLDSVSILHCAIDGLSAMIHAQGVGRYGESNMMENVLSDCLPEGMELHSGGDLVLIYKLLYPSTLSNLHKKRQISLYYTIERPLISLLVAMERRGILVDCDILRQLLDEYSAKLTDIEKEIYDIAGEEFNIASAKQLSYVLFEQLDLPMPIKRKAGARHYSTNVEVLEHLSMQGFEIADLILSWRRLFKIVSTYVKPLLNNASDDDDKLLIHCVFSSLSTNTGRLSCHSPNLQNIPVKSSEGRRIRDVFIADEGKVLLSADYSQIEIMLLAHIAKVVPLREALNANIDIHALTASQVFGLNIDAVSTEWRNKAKTINFGIIYGMSAFGLARSLNITMHDAKQYIDKYFAQYPGIKDYMENVVREAKMNGYITTIYGRRCYIKNIHSSNKHLVKMAERSAINAPIQGAAADIIKRAMVKLPYDLSKYLKLQIHDELLFEIEKDRVNDVAAAVRNVMESVDHLDIKLNVNIKVGASWGGMVPLIL